MMKFKINEDIGCLYIKGKSNADNSLLYINHKNKLLIN